LLFAELLQITAIHPLIDSDIASRRKAVGNCDSPKCSKPAARGGENSGLRPLGWLRPCRTTPSCAARASGWLVEKHGTKTRLAWRKLSC
jgi:hypothetical protein